MRTIVRKICLALFREISWIKENVYVFEICLLWFSFLIWPPSLLALCNWRVYRITKFIDFLFQCIHIVLLNDHIFANESETSHANCQRIFFFRTIAFFFISVSQNFKTAIFDLVNKLLMTLFYFSCLLMEV